MDESKLPNNPYDPPASERGLSVIVAQPPATIHQCPVCLCGLSRIKHLYPFAKCRRCRTRIFLRLDLRYVFFMLISLIAIGTLGYQWLLANPQWFIAHIWWFGLAPLPLIVLLMQPLTIAVGIPCAHNGWRRLTNNEIVDLRRSFDAEN